MGGSRVSRDDIKNPSFFSLGSVLLSVDSKLAFGSYTLAFGTEWTQGHFLPSSSSKTLGTQSFLTLTDQANSHSYPSALLLSSGSRPLAAFLGPVTRPLPSPAKLGEAGGWPHLKQALRTGMSEQGGGGSAV